MATPTKSRRPVPIPLSSPTSKSSMGTARPQSMSTPTTGRRRPPSTIKPLASANLHSPETLSLSLKQETEKKEQLLLQVQNHEQTITALSAENTSITSALNAAETRLNELYAEQARWDMELAQRLEIAEKLREQVRELEKEKRDVQRRYNEQTASFDAERQSFYDNEQHLKSRIQSLSQARRRAESLIDKNNVSVASTREAVTVRPVQPPSIKATPTSDYTDPDNEPAEMTALRLELSTLSTSYTSMQSTLVHLQSQLVDLKRVNQGLQEENESYMILLREKTLSGQYDIMRQVGSRSDQSSDAENSDGDEEGNGMALSDSLDERSLHSTGRSLHRVDEEPEGLHATSPGDHVFPEMDVTPAPSLPPPRFSRLPGRNVRKRTHSAPVPRGESLADLPITGPGLDLAAELGRAESKDILEGNIFDANDDRNSLGKGRVPKKGVDGGRKVSGGEERTAADLETLRNEIKALKDANKALSLYASKIIDRIISQEGFEHVLAADYEPPKDTPNPATPGRKFSAPALHSTSSPPKPQPRPQSLLISRTTSSPAPITITQTPVSPPMKTPTPTQAKRRSLSFDWKSFSFTTEPKKPDPPANLRPLTLKPGSSPVVVSARKLDTVEDEEDRKERERLAATMKLMGIQTQTSIHTSKSAAAESSANAGNNHRHSLIGAKGGFDNSDAASTHSRRSVDSSRVPVGLGLGLTSEALAQAEAQNSLAALDARERNLTKEIADGGSGGFTEISRRPRKGRRSELGGSGSGSTVFSAGMSGEND